MKYCIGEFSSLLGISKDTLRLYEKHDIVRPVKDQNNSYRYFSDLDARDLLMSRWYRSLQIPLQDVAGLIKHSSIDAILKKLESSKRQLEAEIRKNTMLLNKLTELNQNIEAIESSLYRCTLKHVPGLYRLRQTNKNSLLKNDGLKETVNALMEMLPYTFYGFRIERGTILADDSNNLEHSWGITMTEEDAGKLGIEVNDQLEFFPPTTCVSAVIVSPNGENFTKDALQFMLQHIKEHRYFISGDLIGKLILTENQEGHKRSYLEVNIPVSAQDDSQ